MSEIEPNLKQYPTKFSPEKNKDNTWGNYFGEEIKLSNLQLIMGFDAVF